MKFVNAWRNNTARLGQILLLAVTLLTAASIGPVGCTTTIAPRVVESSKPSWDGTNANSGFVGFSGEHGIITPHARERYNGLIEIYGRRFVPPVAKDYGITPGTDGNYLITPHALTYFTAMNRWRKAGASGAP